MNWFRALKRECWKLRDDWRDVRRAMSVQMATLLGIIPPILAGFGYSLPIVAGAIIVLLGLTIWGWMVQQEELRK